MMLVAFYNLFGQLGVTSLLEGALISDSQMMTMFLQMIYVGIGIFVGRLISVPCIEYVCSSMMLKYKHAYLKAVLRQDVGWYDVSHPEELSTKFAEAMVKVQKGLKAQGMLFEGLGYGSGGLVLAFVPAFGNPEVASTTLPTEHRILNTGHHNAEH